MSSSLYESLRVLSLLFHQVFGLFNCRNFYVIVWILQPTSLHAGMQLECGRQVEEDEYSEGCISISAQRFARTFSWGRF